MASSPQLEIQQAILNRLRGDATLTSLLGGQKVYDRVPPGTAYPYITIGEDTEAFWGAKDFAGARLTIRLHIWSSYEGRKEAKQILSRLRELLDRQELTLTNHYNTLLELELAETVPLPEEEGPVVHGVVQLRALTHPI